MPNPLPFNETRTGEMLQATIARMKDPTSLKEMPGSPAGTIVALNQYNLVKLLRLAGVSQDSPAHSKILQDFDMMLLMLLPELFAPENAREAAWKRDFEASRRMFVQDLNDLANAKRGE